MAQSAQPDDSLALASAEDLAREIEAKWTARIREKKRLLPVRSNRASLLDDPCLRRLYLHRTAWQQQALPDDVLQSIFEEGKLHEEAVQRVLSEMGFRVVRSQLALDWPVYEISGTIDGEIEWRGAGVPVEVKSVGPKFDRLRSSDDLRHGNGFVRKWFGQIQLYLLLYSREAGLCLLKSKQTGQMRVIPVALDYEYAEALVKNAEAVNAAVKRGEPPAFVEDTTECARCAYFGRACNPPSAGDGAAVAISPELLDAAETWTRTRAAAKEHEVADKAIKDACRGVPLSVVGPVVVASKSYTATVYDVPAPLKRDYARKEDRVRVEIRAVVGGS